jgi:hypothetical protein
MTILAMSTRIASHAIIINTIMATDIIIMATDITIMAPDITIMVMDDRRLDLYNFSGRAGTPWDESESVSPFQLYAHQACAGAGKGLLRNPRHLKR